MQHMMIKPGAPTLLEMYFTDPRTGEVYKDFKIMHGKYMHMVIANQDLSVFKHVHPYFDPITGRYAITLNMPFADPDNQDAILALSKPGMYMIMTDVIVNGVGMRMDHAMVHVMGPMKKEELKLDEHQNHIITKFFRREQEEEPTYKTVFSKRSITGCSGSIVHFEIEMYHLVNDQYIPLMDFQPWLSEAGHAVWMSEGYMADMHHRMPFAHMHSSFILNDDDQDPIYRVEDHILRFNFHDQQTMLSGKQKIWVQFKHRGKIMKIPFVFDYQADEPSKC